MKKVLFLFSAIVLLSFTLEPLTNVEGWVLAGSEPESYEIGVENDADRNGKVGFIKSTNPKTKGFGTIMQGFIPEKYLDKRVKLTAYIKTKDVKDWTGLWMRVDGAPEKDGKNRKTLAFDNMNDRKITGNTSWEKYEIVLDVDKEAVNLAYGVLLAGTGSVWLDDITFEIVEKSQTTTTVKKITAPQNTSFED
ncbi:hypothetical protein [Brumimicrobium mesophilum]|uniref:hypothetical protein n=1 Tax=Brumimicrobium mesophilum TaxID=392717 RepID=UPI000D141836|nr:hypothetical protein [Brumimicrobium mesophilum]